MTRAALPVVSVVAVEERLVGPIGSFELSRTGPTTGPLRVRASFAATRSNGRPQTTTVLFHGGARRVTSRVQTGDNGLIEGDIVVTFTVLPGGDYTVSAEQGSASLVLEESEVAELAVSVEPATIAEGESATVRVAVVNQVRFATSQTISLSTSGTAGASDFAALLAALTLPARALSVSAALAATADEVQEVDETVTVAASHAGASIGSATVTITDSAATPLTARFVDMPGAHDGSTAFEFELRFSEEVRLSYRTLRGSAFELTNAAVLRARRVAKGSNLRWTIRLRPASGADVALALPATTDCAAPAAICTRGGKPLSNRLEATVAGPGAEAAGFALAPENAAPSGIWSDGTTAWVADAADARLYAYRLEDGRRQAARDIATGPSPMGLWSDGNTLWVAQPDARVRAYRLGDGARAAERDLALEPGAMPAGVWSDGDTAWVSEWLGDTVYAYRLSDGSRLAARDIRLARDNLLPLGLWSDGQTLWVADWAERIHAYRLSDGGPTPERDIRAGAGDRDFTGLWADGRMLLATSRDSLVVLAYGLPQGSAAAVRGPDSPGISVPGVSIVADPALRRAIGAALSKAARESVNARDLASLETLDARNAGITDLSGIGDARGLRELDLGFNPLADLGPLARLHNLESLNLDGAAPDPAALPPLPRLRRLSVRHNGLEDLSALAGRAALKELDVGDNRIEDVGPLAGMAGLEVLRADRNRIADIWPLASLAGLKVLDLQANRLDDLRPLAGMAQLRTLRLGRASLPDAYPLAGLANLQELAVVRTGGLDVQSLSGLLELRRLDLRGTRVHNLHALGALPALAWLHIGGSRIGDVAPLAGRTGLTLAGQDDVEAPHDAAHMR